MQDLVVDQKFCEEEPEQKKMSEFWGILGWGLAGMVGGMGYKVAHLKYSQQKGAEKLTPKTDVLWQHQELFALCLKLQKFKSFDKFNFDQSIINIDRLLYFQQVTKESGFEVEKDDQKISFGYFKTAQDHLKQLYASVHNKGTPKKVAQVKRIYSDISEILQGTWLKILNAIRNDED